MHQTCLQGALQRSSFRMRHIRVATAKTIKIQSELAPAEVQNAQEKLSYECSVVEKCLKGNETLETSVHEVKESCNHALANTVATRRKRNSFYETLQSAQSRNTD